MNGKCEHEMVSGKLRKVNTEREGLLVNCEQLTENGKR